MRDNYDDEDMPEAVQTCFLCGRPMGEMIEWHHPVPKSRGGRKKESVHPICHRTIHATFSNSELAKTYNIQAKLAEHPDIAKFISWLANKPADFDAPTKKRG